MNTFITLFTISLTVIVCCGLIINFAKTRAGSKKHQLTGMCHKTGGPASACSCSQLLPASAADCPSDTNKES